MSESQIRRIRAQHSPADRNALGFVLDTPLHTDNARKAFVLDADAPLACALFAIDGVQHAEVAGSTIWVRKNSEADWTTLKPLIATAIRTVLDESDAPLGLVTLHETNDDPDRALQKAVENLLEQRVNPSVAAHGGHIAVERVENATIFLRMSGGCQGCAASSATLRQGVERMLRAALPEIGNIVGVTDHDAGKNPFYARDGAQSPLLNRPIPPGVISQEEGKVTVDPEYLASRLGLTPDALREGFRNGDVVGVTESGIDKDAGKTRVILRSATRAWAAELLAGGSAREIPPPKPAEAASRKEQGLADRVRRYLENLASPSETVTYGTLAQELGLSAPGSIGKVTQALETTMREDASDGRPFIAARAVSRAAEDLPGRGFFELARALRKGSGKFETDRELHKNEIVRVNRHLSKGQTQASFQ